MKPIVDRILNARRKGLFNSRPLFVPYQPATDLAEVQDRIGTPLPDALKNWLVLCGYGDLDEVLSFRSAWFKVIDRGELSGHVIFAEDILGNFYSFSPIDGSVHVVVRSAPEYAWLAADFLAFIEELERRDFQLQAWIDSLAGPRDHAGH